MNIYTIFVLLMAGLGAGITTGLIGASAVMVATPLMIVFLGVDAYTAIGVSLAIDIFASIVAAFMFYRHNNLNLKPALTMMVFAIAGAYFGSYVSSSIPVLFLSRFTGLVIAGSGINLMIKGGRTKELPKEICGRRAKFLRFLLLAALGSFVGILAGVFGAGGGVTMFLILVFILCYRVHSAVGTSVFIMIFIALSGTIGHIVYGPFSWTFVAIASVAGVFGAGLSAKIANLMKEEQLNRLIGFVFFTLGILMVLNELFKISIGFLGY